jgi:phosphopantetheinyl transferase
MAVFDRLSPDDANGFLLRLWTFKEAIVKATGLGLSVDPRKVAVPDDILQNGPTAELSFEETTWRVHDLGSEGYAAALAHAA